MNDDKGSAGIMLLNHDSSVDYYHAGRMHMGNSELINNRL